MSGRLLLALILAMAVRCADDARPSASPADPPMRVARNFWPGQFWVDLA